MDGIIIVVVVSNFLLFYSFGLGGAVLSNDLERCERISKVLKICNSRYIPGSGASILVFLQFSKQLIGHMLCLVVDGQLYLFLQGYEKM